jgi:hypothetical protein
MRVGINPQKLEKKLDLVTNHRVIVVVYIPNQDGFYKDSFDVFKLCLDSLIATLTATALLTVVNNGSHQKIFDFLNLYYSEKKIDTLISHSTNIGKIDALIGAARGAREKYITLSDSDILFKQGWQENVEAIFSAFKKAGSVSPIPTREGQYFGTSSVLKQIILRRLSFGYEPIPENFEDYNRYLKSINWDLETAENLAWPVIEKSGVKAVVGSGHQVMTIDRDILFQAVPTNPSLTLVGNNSEYNFVDQPIDKSGKFRLSTYYNYAYHMGNKLEPWMLDMHQTNFEKDIVGLKQVAQGVNLNLYYSAFQHKMYQLKKIIVRKIFKLLYVIK